MDYINSLVSDDGDKDVVLTEDDMRDPQLLAELKAMGGEDFQADESFKGLYSVLIDR